MFVTKRKYRQLEEGLDQAIKDKNYWYEMAQRINSKPFGFEKVVEVDLFNLPKLTKSELYVLRATIRLVMMYDLAKFTDIARNYPNQIQRHLQNLVKKGYLQRVKRGVYKLSFYK